MYNKIQDFKTPQDIYNLFKFFNNFYNIKNILIKFRFPGTNYKRKIYKYLKENHFLNIKTIEYMSKYEKDGFEDFEDLIFFKKIIYGEQSEYSSTMLTDIDLDKITTYMSYYFSEETDDFSYFADKIINSTSSMINKNFIYSLVTETKGFKELDTEEYMVSIKSTDVKEILESLDAINELQEDNFIISANIKNIKKFLEAIL